VPILLEKFFIVAHRGASAYEMGADAIEIDVRVTKDDYVTVIHDETVDRTTNGMGGVSKFTLKELRKLDASFEERKYNY